MARQRIITANSAYRMKRLGKPISTSTAQKFCEYNKLNFDEYFEAVESDEFYAAETVKGYRRVLRTIFNEAIRYDWTTKNPVCATKKDSIVDTISAMEFCFIYGKCLVFALLPLISAVLRAFFLVKPINPPSSAPQRQKWRILYRSRV